MASKDVPIAIIGMSCKFAGGVDSPDKLWAMCAEGRNGWGKIPESRFNIDGFYHPNGEKADTTNVKGGHFLDEDVALFDAGFFNFSAELATCADPQFRLQLEGTYEALESAGLTLQDVAGSNTSVFAGAFFRDYNDAHFRDPDNLPRSLLLGVGSAMASNRLSHWFDLRGPSMSIDTGCSTTLTAFHQACQSLRHGESDMSVVGGANVIINPENWIVMSSVKFLSPDGRSYAFDSRANGYGRGEGSATLIVKRLDDAIKNNDPIRAVVLASGVNQDGKTETITTPSRQAQEALIRDVYLKSGLNPAHTAYFEAHGTGTPTGDPLEIGAISSVFTKAKTSDQPLRVGSVKTNIGHTETASGLASLIKVALSLEKGQILPSANFEEPNEQLQLEERNLTVPTKLETWPEIDGVRRASVNNFGYGGTNAHVVMESYDTFMASNSKALSYSQLNGFKSSSADDSRVLVISARDEQATLAMTKNLATYLQTFKTENEAEFLDNLVYTLGQRRTMFQWTAAVPVKGLADAAKLLEGPKMKPARANVMPRIGYVFTGQGAQWWGMGRELMEAYPVYKAELEEADRHLKELGSTWSLVDELAKDAETTRVNELALSTPLTVAVQCALVKLLESWGVSASAATSHSSGEIAAAYAAGCISLRTAMGICFSRGQLAGKSVAGEVKGSMMAVGLGSEEVEKYIARVTSGQVVVACLNSPTSVTASGDVTAIEELEKLLKEDNVFVRRLRVDAAYHSHHMKAISDTYCEWLSKIMDDGEDISENFMFSSPTTGRRESDGKLIGSPQHWVDSLVQPVQFVESFKNMCFQDPSSKTSDLDVVIEVGPHAALSGPIQEITSLPEFAGSKVKYYSTLVRKSSAVDTMQALACNLLREGQAVKMNAVNFPHGHHAQVLHDLPKYAWTHNVRHWSEPRINKAHRAKSHGPHDLLGSLMPGTNAIAPTWRHLIRLADLPWLRDHVVQSNILYPGAGFICMAIEGAAQLSEDANKAILGYQLRNVEIQQALVIPDDSNHVEIQLTMRPCNENSIGSHGWKEFQIFSITADDQWLEHCKGQICVELSSTAGPDTESQISLSNMRLTEFKSEQAYRKYLDPETIYTSLRSIGINHGSTFQNLKSIKHSKSQTVSAFSVSDTAAVMPYGHQSPHVIDPTTIDSLFQAAYGAYLVAPESGGKITATLVPRSIKHMYIAADISKQPGHEFKSFSGITRANTQGFSSDIVVYEQNDNEKPVLSLESFSVKSMGTLALPNNNNVFEHEKLSKMEWVPDVTLMDPIHLQKQFTAAFDTHEGALMMDLRRVTIHFISDALRYLSVKDVAQLQWHQKKFYVWMKLQAQLAAGNHLGPNSSTWADDSAEDRAKVLQATQNATLNGKMVCRLGKVILPILRNEMTPLEVMMEDKLLHDYYCGALKWQRTARNVGEVCTLLAKKNPRAKILEIGGGTGGVTRYVLEGIGSDHSGTGPLAASYDFTDISVGFFEDAREQFKDWKSLVRYKKLDIEQDPQSQGFEEGSYDLVIACQVLHATKNMEHTMANVRKLMKPDGKLVLMETTHDTLDVFFTFAFLPGWWLSEEPERATSANLSVDHWDHVLRKTGFTGIDTEIPDCDSAEFYSTSIMLSSARQTKPSRPESNVTVITTKASPPTLWLDQLRVAIFHATGSIPTVQSIETAKVDGQICIVVGEVVQPLLSDLSATGFDVLKEICTKSKGILWVTRGGTGECADPEGALATGFLRTLRAEYAGKRLVTFDLEATQEMWTASSIVNLAQVYTQSFDYGQVHEKEDCEFAERGGVVKVARYIRDAERNSALFIDSADNKPAAPIEPFIQEDRPLRLSISTPGLLDTLVFTDDFEAATDLPANYIEVSPKAFGVNFRDVMVAMGQLDADYMGFECSGVVTRAGAEATAHGFKAGDRITTLLRGHYSSAVRTEWTNAVHIPDDLSYETAATLPMTFATAYVSLFDIGRIQQGDKVLIHAAAGGVGQAAVILAQHIGAEVYITVGTEQKREFMIKTHGISPERIFSSRNASFASGIMAATQGKGVDVVLNSLSGLMLQESFNCMARFGRFVEIGKRDLEQNHSLEMGAFTRNISFSSVDLLQLEEFKAGDISRIMNEIIGLLKQKLISAVQPITVFPLNEVEKAYRLLQTGKHMGKIVLTIQDDVKVPVLARSRSVSLRQDASYLIVAGLEGLGGSICRWLVEHGAKNVIFSSRSANKGGKNQAFIDEMSKLGCTVTAVPCDVSDQAALTSALRNCAKDLPPIRGVIQGAMVLQDSIVEQMTYDNYLAAVRPKVNGSRNLHQLFDTPECDFFIMLSSLSGIVGFVSQANYSAGNTYQDSLARHRRERGLHGVAIDIGIVDSVGYVAERQETFDRLRKSGYRVLSEADVLNTVEQAVLAGPSDAQMILGLNGANLEQTSDLRFAALRYRAPVGDGAAAASSNGASSSLDLSAQLAAATTLAAATSIVLDSVIAKLADIFMVVASEIDPAGSVADTGVDSLVAVELRNLLALRAGAEISIFAIMQSKSINALAETVVAKSRFVPESLVADGAVAATA